MRQWCYFTVYAVLECTELDGRGKVSEFVTLHDAERRCVVYSQMNVTYDIRIATGTLSNFDMNLN